jgi:hypothetical protein
MSIDIYAERERRLVGEKKGENEWLKHSNRIRLEIELESVVNAMGSFDGPVRLSARCI